MELEGMDSGKDADDQDPPSAESAGSQCNNYHVGHTIYAQYDGSNSALDRLYEYG
jgi:hypothetical protein